MILLEPSEQAILRLYCIKRGYPFHQLKDWQLRMIQNTYGLASFRFAVALRNLCRELKMVFKNE